MVHLARNPVHSPPALRALDLQFYPHTTLLPHKKPVLTCVNTGLTCMLYGARSLHALTCMLCGTPSLHALTCMLCGARNPVRSRLAPAARTRSGQRVYLLPKPAPAPARLREALDAVLGDE